MPITLEATLLLKDQFTAGMKSAGSAAMAGLQSIVDIGSKVAAGAEAGFSVLEGKYSALGGVLGALPGPIGQVAGAIGSAVGGAMEAAEGYNKSVMQLQRATGMTAEAASTLIATNLQVGISADKTVTEMTRFSKALGGAMDAEGTFANAGKGLAANLKDIGINATDATGKVRPINDLLPQIADYFQRIGPGAQASAEAMKLFGRTGTDLLPVLLKGSAGLKEYAQNAKDAGMVLSQELLNKQKAVIEMQHQMEFGQQSLNIRLGEVFIPMLGHLDNELGAVAKDWTLLLDPARLTAAALGEDAAMAGRAAAGMKQEADASDAAAVAAKAQADMMTGLKGAMSYVPAGMDAMANAAGALKNQEDALKTAISAVSTAMTSQAGVLRGEAADEMAVKIATGQVTQAQFEQAQAAAAVAAAHRDGILTDAQYIAAEAGLAKGTLTTGQAFLVAAGEGTVFKQNTQDVMTAVAGADAIAKGYSTTLSNIPGNVSTHVDIQVTGMGGLREADAMLRQIAMSGGTHPVNIPGHDYPGPAMAGQPYRIGVPEIFVPNTGGQIIPIGGAKSGGNTYNITVNAGPINTPMDVEVMAYRISQVIKRRST